LDGTDSAGGAGENDIPWQQGHIGRDEADQIRTTEDKLAGIRVLAKLPVLEQLNGQIVRIDLGYDVRPERCERVKGFAARPLTFRVLDGAISDILRRSIAKDVTGGRSRRHIARPPAYNNRQFRLKIRSVVGKRDNERPKYWVQGLFLVP